MEANREPKSLIDLVQLHPNYVRDMSDFTFQTQVGEGGFGIVWLALDHKTNKLCAIKEINDSLLEGTKLRRFLREVDTIVQVRNRFVVPFVGFSVESPYSIVTEYLSEGTLSHMLYKEKDEISGTKLTIIALCLAHGLRALHKHGIVHRDLKTGNILLTDKKFPRIIDFGLARLASYKSPNSRGVGTINYMAPEIFRSGNYNHKVDIYAFGMILYAMLEKLPPFKKMKPPEIQKLVVELDERPKFSNIFPSSIKTLITRCWATDPNSRPDFSEIYELFAKGKATFPHTNTSKVIDVARKIEEENEYLESQPQPEGPLVNIQDILRRLGTRRATLRATMRAKQLAQDHQVETTELQDNPQEVALELEDFQFEMRFQSGKPKISYSNFNVTALNPILNDPNDPQFCKVLLQEIPNIDSTNFSDFFSIVNNYLQTKTVNDFTKNVIVVGCYMLMKKNEIFIQLFYTEHYFYLLPFNSDKFIDIVCCSLALLFRKCPTLVDVSLKNLIAKLILVRPLDSIFLMSLLTASVCLMTDLSFFDIMIQHYNLYSTDNLSPYLVTYLFELVTKSEEFAASKKALVFEIFSEFVRGQHINTCKYSVRAYCQFDLDDIPIPYDGVLYHLQNPYTAPSIISLLYRVKNLPASKTLAGALIARAKVDQKANLLLCKFVDTSPQHLSILVYISDWIQYLLPTIQDTLRLFLVCFRTPYARKELSSSPYLGNFFVNLANSKIYEVFSKISSILRRLQIDQNIFDVLEKSKFFEIYFTEASQSGDDYVLNNTIVLLDFLSRNGYSESYLIFFPKLLELMTNHSNWYLYILTALVSLSQHPQLHSTFKNKKLDAYFESLKQYPEYLLYANTFLANISK